jgi:hypothetical protein
MGVGSLGDLWAWTFMPMVGTHGHGGICWHGFKGLGWHGILVHMHKCNMPGWHGSMQVL